MRCKDIQIDLNKFIDNELSHENNLIINEHLNKCKQCQDDVKALQNLKSTIASLEMPTLKDDFNITLNNRLNNNSLHKKFKRLLPLAASIALLVPLTYFLTYTPTTEVGKILAVELLTAGNSSNNDYEEFHQWTQVSDLQGNLACSNLEPMSYCSLDSPFNHNEANPNTRRLN